MFIYTTFCRLQELLIIIIIDFKMSCLFSKKQINVFIYMNIYIYIHNNFQIHYMFLCALDLNYKSSIFIYNAIVLGGSIEGELWEILGNVGVSLGEDKPCWAAFEVIDF